MDWLNYNHLYYFWVVAREGGITRASDELGVSQPTISTQLADLERRMGGQLFDRKGRSLVLTELGKTAFEYAGQIFGLGRELMQTVRGRLRGPSNRLAVGIADVVPKLIVRRLLEPFFAAPPDTRLVCVEDKPDRLIAELAVHNLDLVIVDSPPSPALKVKAFQHTLGESGTSFFASESIARQLGQTFPQSLDGAPFLVTLESTAHRRAIDAWLESQNIHPRIRGEFADTALLKTFGQYGAGVFAMPSAIEPEILADPGMELIGRTDAVRARYFALTVERRLRHPVVAAIVESARRDLFG